MNAPGNQKILHGLKTNLNINHSAQQSFHHKSNLASIPYICTQKNVNHMDKTAAQCIHASLTLGLVLIPHSE